MQQSCSPVRRAGRWGLGEQQIVHWPPLLLPLQSRVVYQNLNNMDWVQLWVHMQVHPSCVCPS
jgi:hypothetical protein